jgi:hypothetical protein
LHLFKGIVDRTSVAGAEIPEDGGLKNDGHNPFSGDPCAITMPNDAKNKRNAMNFFMM